MPPEPKRLIDLSGSELRQRAREHRGGPREEIVAELERRRDNLRGATIPYWEFAKRGADPEKWDLLR